MILAGLCKGANPETASSPESIYSSTITDFVNDSPPCTILWPQALIEDISVMQPCSELVKVSIIQETADL